MAAAAAESAGVIRVRAVVDGRVQGVWFRQTCRREAERLGLSGWVRNRPDGRVEIEAQGDPAAVDALVAWAHVGPPLAVVHAVEAEQVGIRSHDVPGFVVR